MRKLDYYPHMKDKFDTDENGKKSVFICVSFDFTSVYVLILLPL